MKSDSGLVHICTQGRWNRGDVVFGIGFNEELTPLQNPQYAKEMRVDHELLH